MQMQEINKLQTQLREKNEKTGEETAETTDLNQPPLMESTANEGLQKPNTAGHQQDTEKDTNESQK